MKYKYIKLTSCFLLIFFSIQFDVLGQKKDISYGYTPENPVKVGRGKNTNTENERTYLELLRDEHDDLVEFKMFGTCCPFPSNNGINGMGTCNLYKVRYKDKKGKEHQVILYLTYFEYDKPEAPSDFTLATMDIEKEFKSIEFTDPEAGKTKEIKFNASGIKIIPENVFNLYELEILEVNLNQIQSIPSQISNLKMLRRFEFAGNKIMILPAEIAQLDSLREIHLNKELVLEDAFLKLGNLPCLEKIVIEYCNQPIPNNILACKKLKILQLQATNCPQVSVIEQERLKKLLPKCSLIFK